MSDSAKLDVAAALRLTLATFWRDFAPIVLLGVLFIILPELLLQFLAAGGGDAGVATLATTVRWLFVMMFFSAVSAGSLLSAHARRALAPLDYVRGGLRNMQPGLIAALVIGAALVGIRIVQMLLGSALSAGELMAMLFYAVLVAVFVYWIAAVPAAIAERLMPLRAIRRAAAISAGNRWRLVGLLAVVVVALLPPLLIVQLVIFGPSATPSEIAEVQAAMSPATPAFWIAQLMTMLIFGVIAVLPPTLYLILARSVRRA